MAFNSIYPICVDGQEVCSLSYTQINDFFVRQFKLGVKTEQVCEQYRIMPEYEPNGTALAKLHFLDKLHLTLFLMNI